MIYFDAQNHFAKTLPVESEVVRKLIRSDDTRTEVFEETLERCLEILAGATRASVHGVAARVRSITPVELSEVRDTIAAEEEAISMSMSMQVQKQSRPQLSGMVLRSCL